MFPRKVAHNSKTLEYSIFWEKNEEFISKSAKNWQKSDLKQLFRGLA